MSGPIAQYAELLDKANIRIEFPIRGERKTPRPDFSEVNFSSLMKQAAEPLRQKQIRDDWFDLLKDIAKPKP
jgi:hypothetical protein